MGEMDFYKLVVLWLVFYGLTYFIWAVFLHKKYGGCRNTLGTYLLAGVLWYLCCIGGWAFMLWTYFAPEEQLPAALKR